MFFLADELNRKVRDLLSTMWLDADRAATLPVIAEARTHRARGPTAQENPLPPPTP